MHSTDEVTKTVGELPSWAKKLLKRPLVEVRRGFSLGYEAPSEDASTIVLTAPSGNYVDIRFSILPPSQEALAVKDQSRGHIRGYATAGLSTATILPGKGGCPSYGCTVHATWEHSIDSSGSFDKDGADLLLLADGARMEVGCMVIRGEIQMFKEYWITPTGSSTELPCAVVELKDSCTVGGEGERAKGMAIRIGDYCQGIFQHDNDFYYERWEFKGDEQRWIKDPRSNTPTSEMGILPCWWMLESARTLGEVLVTDGREWCVTEALLDTPEL